MHSRQERHDHDRGPLALARRLRTRSADARGIRADERDGIRRRVRRSPRVQPSRNAAPGGGHAGHGSGFGSATHRASPQLQDSTCHRPAPTGAGRPGRFLQEARNKGRIRVQGPATVIKSEGPLTTVRWQSQNINVLTQDLRKHISEPCHSPMLRCDRPRRAHGNIGLRCRESGRIPRSHRVDPDPHTATAAVGG